MGQLHHPAAGIAATPGLDRLRDAAVHPRPARGAEVLVQGVLDECVGKRVAPGQLLDLAHQRARGRGVEDVQQLVLRALRHRREQVEVELPPDDRGKGQDLSCVLAQPRHP